MSPRSTMTFLTVMVAALVATTVLPAARAAEEQAAAKAPGLVSQIKVLPDKAPDCSSLCTGWPNRSCAAETSWRV